MGPELLADTPQISLARRVSPQLSGAASRRTAEDALVLRVMCFESELGEYGEVVAVGDFVDRLAVRQHASSFPPGESVEWTFDRYAEVAGGPPFRVRGVVTAIQAVFVTGDLDAPAARLSAVPSTDRTIRPPRRPPPPDAGQPDGRGGRWVPVLPRRPEDEELAGWLLTLDRTEVTPHDRGW